MNKPHLHIRGANTVKKRFIICVIYVLCLSCFRVCSLLPCGHHRESFDLLALVCDVVCDFVTFPFQFWDRCGT